MSSLRTYKLLDIASLVIIALVIFIIGMFLYIRFAPVDVINNKTWVMCTAPIKTVSGRRKCETGVPTYRVGQTITVYISSDKTRAVGGWFTTTAECENNTGVFVSYPISEQHVNRAKGHVETAIDTQISNKIPNLPTTCRIGYILEYSIFSFRSFSEYNFTNNFILEHAPTTPQSSPPVVSIPSFAPTIFTVPFQVPVATMPSTAPTTTTGAASSSPPTAPAETPPASTPPSKPNPITTLLNSIRKLL